MSYIVALHFLKGTVYPYFFIILTHGSIFADGFDFACKKLRSVIDTAESDSMISLTQLSKTPQCH